MKVKQYILAGVILSTVNLSCAYAENGAPSAPNMGGSAMGQPPAPNMGGSAMGQPPAPIQGQDASGAAQETIVDQGGNLKIAPAAPAQGQGGFQQPPPVGDEQNVATPTDNDNSDDNIAQEDQEEVPTVP